MRDGDWETVFRVADARQALFEQFDGAATSPLSAPERDRLAHVLIELGELDAQITRGTLERLREVKAELDACDDGLGVVSGYQWANNTGVQKMIDCYG